MRELQNGKDRGGRDERITKKERLEETERRENYRKERMQDMKV